MHITKGDIMTEEIKEERTNRGQWSISPDFARFLLTILASFLGCLVALCLYGAAVKPALNPCPVPPPRYEAPVYHHKGEFRPDRVRKHHKMHVQAPNKQDIQIPDRKAPEAKK